MRHSPLSGVAIALVLLLLSCPSCTFADVVDRTNEAFADGTRVTNEASTHSMKFKECTFSSNATIILNLASLCERASTEGKPAELIISQSTFDHASVWIAGSCPRHSLGLVVRIETSTFTNSSIFLVNMTIAEDTPVEVEILGNTFSSDEYSTPELELSVSSTLDELLIPSAPESSPATFVPLLLSNVELQSSTKASRITVASNSIDLHGSFLKDISVQETAIMFNGLQLKGVGSQLLLQKNTLNVTGVAGVRGIAFLDHLLIHDAKVTMSDNDVVCDFSSLVRGVTFESVEVRLDGPAARFEASNNNFEATSLTNRGMLNPTKMDAEAISWYASELFVGNGSSMRWTSSTLSASSLRTFSIGISMPQSEGNVLAITNGSTLTFQNLSVTTVSKDDSRGIVLRPEHLLVEGRSKIIFGDMSVDASCIAAWDDPASGMEIGAVQTWRVEDSSHLEIKNTDIYSESNARSSNGIIIAIGGEAAINADSSLVIMNTNITTSSSPVSSDFHVQALRFELQKELRVQSSSSVLIQDSVLVAISNKKPGRVVSVYVGPPTFKYPTENSKLILESASAWSFINTSMACSMDTEYSGNGGTNILILATDLLVSNQSEFRGLDCDAKIIEKGIGAASRVLQLDRATVTLKGSSSLALERFVFDFTEFPKQFLTGIHAKANMVVMDRSKFTIFNVSFVTAPISSGHFLHFEGRSATTQGVLHVSSNSLASVSHSKFEMRRASLLRMADQFSGLLLESSGVLRISHCDFIHNGLYMESLVYIDYVGTGIIRDYGAFIFSDNNVQVASEGTGFSLSSLSPEREFVVSYSGVMSFKRNSITLEKESNDQDGGQTVVIFQTEWPEPVIFSSGGVLEIVDNILVAENVGKGHIIKCVTDPLEFKDDALLNVSNNILLLTSERKFTGVPQPLDIDNIKLDGAHLVIRDNVGNATDDYESSKRFYGDRVGGTATGDTTITIADNFLNSSISMGTFWSNDWTVSTEVSGIIRCNRQFAGFNDELSFYQTAEAFPGMASTTKVEYQKCEGCHHVLDCPHGAIGTEGTRPNCVCLFPTPTRTASSLPTRSPTSSLQPTASSTPSTTVPPTHSSSLTVSRTSSRSRSISPSASETSSNSGGTISKSGGSMSRSIPTATMTSSFPPSSSFTTSPQATRSTTVTPAPTRTPTASSPLTSTGTPTMPPTRTFTSSFPQTPTRTFTGPLTRTLTQSVTPSIPLPTPAPPTHCQLQSLRFGRTYRSVELIEALAISPPISKDLPPVSDAATGIELDVSIPPDDVLALTDAEGTMRVTVALAVPFSETPILRFEPPDDEFTGEQDSNMAQFVNGSTVSFLMRFSGTARGKTYLRKQRRLKIAIVRSQLECPTNFRFDVNFTVTVSALPPPIPAEVKEGVQVAAVSAVAAASVVGAPTQALVQTKLGALASLTFCDFDHTEKLDVSTSILGWKFGPAHGAYYRGAVIGNFVFLVGVSSGLAIIGVFLFFLFKPKPPPMPPRFPGQPRFIPKPQPILGPLKSAFGFLHLPGLLIVPFVLISQGTSSASTSLFVHAADWRDPIIAVFGVLIVWVPSITLLVITTVKFDCILTKRQEDDKRFAAQEDSLSASMDKTLEKSLAAAAAEEEEEPPTTMERIRDYWIGTAWKWRDITENGTFKRHFMHLFMDYDKSYYLAIEVIATNLVGVMEGIRIKNQGFCTSVIALMLGTFGILLAAGLFLRPCLDRFNSLFMHLLNACVFFAAVFLLAGHLTENETLQEAEDWVGMVAMILGMLKFIGDCVFIAVWMHSHRKRVKRLWSKLGKAVNKSAPPPPPPPKEYPGFGISFATSVTKQGAGSSNPAEQQLLPGGRTSDEVLLSIVRAQTTHDNSPFGGPKQVAPKKAWFELYDYNDLDDDDDNNKPLLQQPPRAPSGDSNSLHGDNQFDADDPTLLPVESAAAVPIGQWDDDQELAAMLPPPLPSHQPAAAADQNDDGTASTDSDAEILPRRRVPSFFTTAGGASLYREIQNRQEQERLALAEEQKRRQEAKKSFWDANGWPDL